MFRTLFVFGCVVTIATASTATSSVRSKYNVIEREFDIDTGYHLVGDGVLVSQVKSKQIHHPIHEVSKYIPCDSATTEAMKCADTDLWGYKMVYDCLENFVQRNCSLVVETKVEVKYRVSPNVTLCHNGSCSENERMPHIVVFGHFLEKFHGKERQFVSLDLHPSRPLSEFAKGALHMAPLAAGGVTGTFTKGTQSPDCDVDSHGRITNCRKANLIRLPEEDESMVYILYSGEYDYMTDVTIKPALHLRTTLEYDADGRLV